MGVLSSIVDGVFGIGATAANNTMAAEREKLARKENYQYGEMAASAADQRTRNLYNDLYSPTAKMNQIREAGLSPALFGDLAGSGGSGQAGAQGTGASGVSPTTYGIDPMLLADIELKQAQTEKIKEETKTESGTNERGAAEIAKTWAEEGAKKASECLMKSQETGVDLDNELKNKTLTDNIRRANYLANKEYEESREAGYLAEEEGLKLQFDKDTYNSRIEEQFKRVENIISNTNLNEQQIKYLQSRIKEIQENIKQEWEKVAVTHSTWRSYDELVANQIHKLSTESKAIPEELRLRENGQILNFLSSLIGSAAHIAGMSMKK